MATIQPLLGTRHDSRKVRIIFLHHSTGRNLIRQGKVRTLLAAWNRQHNTHYEFWDHDYNRIGLADASGKRTDITFDIPNDNTDPDGLDALFSQPVRSPADNAFSHLLEYQVVVFKSCFPVSAIKSARQLEQYKKHYERIRRAIEAHPEVLFIALTPPPLIPRIPFLGSLSWGTTRDEAQRARAFAKWLTAPEYRGTARNLATFDLFDALACPSDAERDANVLKPEFRSLLGLDSHPNYRANSNVAPVFVRALCAAIEGYFTSRPDVVAPSTSAQIGIGV